ncbi:MAG: thiamine pyrophosphate-binding protein [Ruminiclostridium sp.]|nr:thiamine pyrophosphate-binding protein [Ruminiclostridium sp.]
MSVRVADLIMEKLSGAGAKHIFMVTGRGVLYLSDAAARSENINGVSMHHEQACAYAAMAYSQYNGKIGACLVSTGCAGTNALTPVLCAYQDGVPMVVVSGQNTLRETSRYSGIPLRTWGQQEADIIKLAEPVTKYAVMLTDPKRTVYEVEKALYMATCGQKGPVWIDVPLDVQNMRIDPEAQEHFIPEEEVSVPSPDDIGYVKNALENAKRPCVLIGSGIRSSGSENLLAEFSEKNNIPVVYSSSAADVYSYDKLLCMGSVGMMACSRSGAFAVQNSDLLLVLGNRLSPMTTGGEYGKFARSAEIIVVDIDETEHSKNTVRIDKFIKADVGSFLNEMNCAEFSGDYSQWIEKCAHWKEIFPLCEDMHRNREAVDLYRLAEALSEVMDSGHTLLTDAGLEELILPSNVIFSGNRRCLHPVSQGAMGYALPAAVGAYYSGAEKTAAVIGDGSIMMNLQELATIAYNRVPVKIIVVNNDLYAVIRKRQRDIFRTRTIGTDKENGVGVPDFKKVAECFGIKYMRIETDGELSGGLERLFGESGAVLCEIMGDPDQDYICCAVARTNEKRFVNRPLEDQSPFMDRELFLREMVIEPIDQ